MKKTAILGCRSTIFILALALLTALLAGCGAFTFDAPPAPDAPAAPLAPEPPAAPDAPNSPAAPPAPAAPAPPAIGADEKISIVCTIFPLYDWVRQILGGNTENVELSLLVRGGIDLHSYQPSVQDMVNIAQCDLFVYIGGESDAWVEDALAQAANPGMLTVKLLDSMESYGGRARAEELADGMQAAEAPVQEEVLDEHVWLSLKNAEACCHAIYDALVQLGAFGTSGTAGGTSGGIAAVNAGEVNLAAYLSCLQELDAQYQAAVDAAPVRILLFADRFPFRYFVEDYGLDYYAAFPGCEAETEASFETIVFLAEKARELNLRHVMVTESADQSIANTIIENAGGETRQILVMNTLQSVTPQDVENGVSYLSLMEENLTVLKEALGVAEVRY